jgi:hypothetical protein
MQYLIEKLLLCLRHFQCRSGKFRQFTAICGKRIFHIVVLLKNWSTCGGLGVERAKPHVVVEAPAGVWGWSEPNFERAEPPFETTPILTNHNGFAIMTE